MGPGEGGGHETSAAWMARQGAGKGECRMSRDMVSVLVPYLGRIEVLWGNKEVRHATGIRRENLVRFLGNETPGKYKDSRHEELCRIVVCRPLRIGGNPNRLYETVSAAFTFLREPAHHLPESFLIEEWEAATNVPMGHVEVSHPNGRKYRVGVEAPIGLEPWAWISGLLKSRRIALPPGWRERAVVECGSRSTWTVTVGGEVYTLNWSGEILDYMDDIQYPVWEE